MNKRIKFQDWVQIILFICCILLIIFVSINTLFCTKCEEYKELCYENETVCTRYGCNIHTTPVDCTDSKVIGTAKFCIKEKNICLKNS